VALECSFFRTTWGHVGPLINMTSSTYIPNYGHMAMRRGRSRGATWQCGRKRKRERGNSSIESQLTSKKRTKKNKKEQKRTGRTRRTRRTRRHKGKQGKQGKHDGAKVLTGSKRNRRCAQVVHQTGQSL